MPPSNEFGQPVGEPLVDWTPPPPPPAVTLSGRYTTLEPLDPDRHTDDLARAFAGAPDALWTYMSFGPFAGRSELEETLRSICALPDWAPYTIVTDGSPAGFASYLRIAPSDGVIEIGSITFSPSLQRTTAATEAIYLMIANAFSLGYRRVEWKCDDLNQPSRSAAVRLGFTYEGTFRQATHYKGRNRHTAWYSIIDREWPPLDQAFQDWLDPANFDGEGRQRTKLNEHIERSR